MGFMSFILFNLRHIFKDVEFDDKIIKYGVVATPSMFYIQLITSIHSISIKRIRIRILFIFNT